MLPSPDEAALPPFAERARNGSARCPYQARELILRQGQRDLYSVIGSASVPFREVEK